MASNTRLKLSYPEKFPPALRLIIILKFFKGSFLLLAAFGLFAIIHKDVGALAERMADYLHIDPDNHTFNWMLDRISKLTPKRILGISLGTLFYAALLLIEGFGLYRRRAWARWLTIIATASFIPLEIYEIVKHVRPGRLLILLVNVFVLIYLKRHAELMPRHGHAHKAGFSEKAN
ncbi:MAG: DUF2127 domain-containing protein [Acidobacteria bacterium]|nr:DUF2127 domain-containing protein [Acidobacteriota bacterium]MBI3655582.1 DUF2127 domain-containing protein [Acidobacteriota bacterium]